MKTVPSNRQTGKRPSSMSLLTSSLYSIFWRFSRYGGNDMLCKVLRKTLAVCLIGLGLGILLVLLLPVTGWLFIIGVTVVCVGLMWLAC